MGILGHSISRLNVGWLVLLLKLTTTSVAFHHDDPTDPVVVLENDDEIVNMDASIERLMEAGFRICHTSQQFHTDNTLVPVCRNQARSLIASAREEESFWFNFVATLLCVSLAALAAGLTLGLLGIDPLLLLIKQRAGATPEERNMASQLLPVLQNRHRLLVTLLLMNAVANEAMPIFLEALVPSPAAAVVVSVTLVLFFGEIIPSAVFTGPNQLQLAQRLVPVVQLALFLLYPLAGPIAKLLDWVLQDEGHDNAAYNRGELSALIRIQYEERLANKRKRRHDQAKAALLLQGGDHVGGLDFSSVLAPPKRKSSIRDVVGAEKRATMRQAERATKRESSKTGHPKAEAINNTQYYVNRDIDNYRKERSPSIHVDEAIMAEGALHMMTKVALDVFTPMRKVFSIPSDMELSGPNLVKIYASGFTRIPVHTPGNVLAITGLLMTKQLIVVDAKDKRAVKTLPLRRPNCVNPHMPLVHLLNLLQTGGDALKGGHMALVCARPSVANKALKDGLEIPESAGLMGLITLEDVLEALLQEQIYDEMDKREQQARRLAIVVFRHWREFVKRKKEGKPMARPPEPALVPVVKEAVSAALEATGLVATEEGRAGETTALLSATPETPKRSSTKIVRSWFSPLSPG